MISLEKPQRKWASSQMEGRTSWIFSSCGRCSGLKTGTSGIALVASGKASPHGSYSGASHASSPVETGISGNFLSCSKGVKDPLEVPEVWCD